MDAQQATALVNQDYAEVLGRMPDPFGYNTLVPLLVAGYDPTAIRAGLAFGSTEAAALVSGLYEAELGRAPDSVGLQHNLVALAAGADLSDLRAGIAASHEALTDVSLLYGQLLGRPADGPGLDQFIVAMGQSYSLSDVRNSMATSPEATGIIVGVYQSILGRSPSAGESFAGSISLQAGGPSQLRATIADGAESQARLSQAYELNFGTAPPATTLSAQEAEMALGRSFADTAQASVLSNGGSGGLARNYGYSIPQQYSATGSAQFISAFNTSYVLYSGGFITVPTPTTGVSAFPSGSDTIVLDLQTINSAPLSFTATLDGQTLGEATISALEPTTPNTTSTQDQVTFTGEFGPGLHQLHIQVTSDPTANALVVQPLATADGSPFLLGTITTTAAGTANIYPHFGSQPATLI